MQWINNTELTLKLIWDLGKGREMIVILPSQIVDLPNSTRKDMDMVAPHLEAYVPQETPKVILEVIPEPIKIRNKPGPKKRNK